MWHHRCYDFPSVVLSDPSEKRWPRGGEEKKEPRLCHEPPMAMASCYNTIGIET
jgi:hypothetical protein